MKKFIAIDLVIMVSISFGVFANYIFALFHEKHHFYYQITSSYLDKAYKIQDLLHFDAQIND